MKTITNEIKAKYFSLYSGQQIEYLEPSKLTELLIGTFVGIWDKHHLHIEKESYGVDILSSTLLLTPIKDITHDDAINVFNIIGVSTHLSDESKAIQCKELFATNNFYTKQTNISASSYLKAFQYLQSKGYALPYMDYSVSDLVENGTIILKTK